MKQNPYKRFARALAAVEKWIIVVALAIGVALTAVNVVCRYIFKANVNFSWSEEVVVALLVLTYMVGAALCSGDEGGLINMTIFTGKMSRRTQLVIEIITNLCLIAFGVIIFISGWGPLRLEDRQRSGHDRAGHPRLDLQRLHPAGCLPDGDPHGGADSGRHR